MKPTITALILSALVGCVAEPDPTPEPLECEVIDVGGNYVSRWEIQRCNRVPAEHELPRGMQCDVHDEPAGVSVVCSWFM